MNGIIERGNYFNRTVEMSGDMEIAGGNWRLAKITTNGFNLTVTSAAVHGLYIDGVKQDAYVWQSFGPYDKTTQILAALEQGGADALCAYEGIVDILQAPDGDTMTMAEFVAAYTELATDNLTYSANLLKKLAVAVQGQEWVDSKTNTEIFAAAQQFINSKTKAQLMGVDTEVVEEIS